MTQMWDYMVLAGQYRLDGADVVIENQKQGRTTLQAYLDHYGKEGFELVSTHFTPGWAAVILKRSRGGAAGAAGPSAFTSAQPTAAAASAVVIDEDGMPVRRRGKAAAEGMTQRRKRQDLDKLYRDDDE